MSGSLFPRHHHIPKYSPRVDCTEFLSRTCAEVSADLQSIKRMNEWPRTQSFEHVHPRSSRRDPLERPLKKVLVSNL
jgi:hypothetical protein